MKLPKGITEKDLKLPSWKDDDRAIDRFELWQVNGMGWVIPTLPIGAAKGSYARRTYGVRVEDGQIVRVGQGPHVASTQAVYVRESRKTALQPFLDLKLKGEQDANQIRDNISTKRARSAARRFYY